MTRTPLLLVGDGPTEPTGLGRILRDLAAQIAASDLPVDLVTCGECTGDVVPWPHVCMSAIDRGADWGKSFVEHVWRRRWDTTPGIVWVIWDPSRLAAFQGLQIPVQLWSYAAVDAENCSGTFGGPARQAIAHADRVIAYGRWASTILKTIRQGAVPYLPHGISTATYAPASPDEAQWARAQLGAYVRTTDRVIGCVATNQPRKDLGLYVATIAELQRRGHKVYGWLHTDTLVKHWSVPQLVEDHSLAKRITVSTEGYDDRELAILYQACSVTIAPGLGEGFGYPIVESLASGVPVAHVDYAGGRELVPRREWRIPVRETRLEGVYALQRPVCRASDAANAIERIWRWQELIGAPAAQAYCRGAVAHLDWASLWPRWRGWIRQGLEG